jgi:hypothetical protein
MDGRKVWQEENDCNDHHVADLPDKEKLSLNIGTSANFLLSNREAYIRSLKVMCTMSFQPQDNYEQMARKLALFFIKGSHTKQMVPDLSYSWSRVLSKTGHLSDDASHDQTLARTAFTDQSEYELINGYQRLSHTQHSLTNRSTSWLMDARDTLAYSIYWPIRSELFFG